MIILLMQRVWLEPTNLRALLAPRAIFSGEREKVVDGVEARVGLIAESFSLTLDCKEEIFCNIFFCIYSFTTPNYQLQIYQVAI
jgi:hypothetical protein